MKCNNIHIEIGCTDGIIGSVVLNGVDYSQKAKSVVYKHVAGEVPTVLLELYPDEVDIRAEGLATINGKPGLLQPKPKAAPAGGINSQLPHEQQPQADM